MQSSPSSNSPKGRALTVMIVVALLRIAVGLLFVASGFAKAVDPWGSVYKIGEYVAVWGWTVPHALLVTGAVALSALEFVAGMMLLLGCYRRSIVVILLLLMAGMLPLSLYIYIADPVADCGCFGDMWHISNAATFFKNIAITAALIFLLRTNRRVRCAVSPYVQWVPAVFSVLYSLLLSFNGYQGQPLVDFRSFPVGGSLLASDDAGGSDARFEFIYEKAGDRRAFPIDELPDSTWTYVDRRLVDGDVGGGDAFTIYDGSGDDVTEDLAGSDGRLVLVAIPTLHDADISYTYYLNELHRYLTSEGIEMAGVIGGGDREAELWRDISMAEYPIYNADPPQIKELVRGSIGLVMLNDGVIEWKRSAGPLLDAVFASGSIDDAPLFAADRRADRLRSLTAIYAVAMIAVIALNNGVLALLAAWRERWRKRNGGKHATSRKKS